MMEGHDFRLQPSNKGRDRLVERRAIGGIDARWWIEGQPLE